MSLISKTFFLLAFFGGGELLILKHSLGFLFSFSQENLGSFLGEDIATCLYKTGSTLLFRDIILKAGGQKPCSDQGLELGLGGAQVCLLISELLGMNGLCSLLLGGHQKCEVFGGFGGKGRGC